jgi:predicted Zn-dependent protease
MVLLALVVGAWFGLAWYQAKETGRASALVGGRSPRLTPRKARQARAALSAAGTLNPDRMVDMLRGQLAFDEHRNTAAERIDRSVVRREPLNLAAWSQLAYAAAATGDRQTLVEAARHISELYPKLKR